MLPPLKKRGWGGFMVDAAMIAPDNLIALPPSMEVAVAYPPYIKSTT
jgi:hypothetical protein